MTPCSLYIHIPYCASKCSYCDFFSIADNGPHVPAKYIRAVKNEIDFMAKKYDISSWRSVYIGGGTPSLLSADDLSFLLGNQSSSETTIEANPSDISKEFLCSCGEAGVSRLSLGIQSFSDEALAFANRRSDSAAIDNAVSLIRSHWRGIFSVDMISGLPQETSVSFVAGLKKLLSLRPHHISLYSLMIEEGTSLGDAVLSGKLKYDDDENNEMWLCGRDLLVSHGYRQYEVSNFCLDGYECLHNMVYWQQENYVGVGAAAAGTVYFDDDRNMKSPRAIRTTNTTDRNAYCDFWASPYDIHEVPEEIQCTEYLDAKTLSFEFFMMGLRTLRGVCREKYIARFGTDFSGQVQTLFSDWVKKGMARIYEKNGRHFYAMTDNGILFLNDFLGQITA